MAIIIGTENSDTLVETSEVDSITALRGDDTIVFDKAETLTDSVDGGSGNDRLVVDLRTLPVNSFVFLTVQGSGPSYSGQTLGSKHVSYSNIENFTVYHRTGDVGDSITTGPGEDAYHFTATNNVVRQRFLNFINLGDGSNDLVSIDASAVVDFTVGNVPDMHNPGSMLFHVQGASRITYRNVERVELIGGALGDSLIGVAGNDVIDGRAGDDTISGRDGDDRLIGGAGNDILNGEEGNDTLVFSTGTDTADGGNGSDRLEIDARINSGLGGSVTLSVTGGPTYSGNFSWTQGSDTHSVAYSNVESFTIHSNRGDYKDVVRTGDGDDVFYHYAVNASTAFVQIDEADLGGGSNDLLVADFSFSPHPISNLFPPDGAWSVFMGFRTGFWNYRLKYQNVERIHFIGTNQGDSVAGLAASDILDGRGGNDTLNGAGGNDDISGGTGTNTIDGGDGDDIVRSGILGIDTVQGGAGADVAIIDYSTLTAAVTNRPGGDVAFGNGTDTGVTLTGVERIVIATGSGNDDVTTLGGDDEIRTGAGTDILNGGAGNDYLDGGAGADAMTGGSGDDVFIVDDSGDTVIEAAGGGSDRVETSLATYQLAANVEVLLAVTAVDHDFRGNAGDNSIRGSSGNDFFRLQDGGADSVAGDPGNDVFYFGGALTPADTADGGAGHDQVALQGDYAGAEALVLGANMISIENIAIMPGDDTRYGDPGTNFYDYDITLQDSAVAAGVQLVIDANRLRVGEDFTFNGSAETDGTIWIYGGGGTDHLTGGARNDVFLFGAWGQWGTGDVIDGGPGGIDQLALRGNYTLTFGAGQLIGIENIGLLSAHDTRFGELGSSYSYDITMVDENVAPGVQMIVDGAKLRIAEFFRFDGSAEADGSFKVFGGFVGDIIIGSRNGDIIVGGPGADMLKGGPGGDLYRYRNAGESTGAVYDTIDGFEFGADQIDLPGTHDSFGTKEGGALSTASFDDDMAAAMSGVLTAGHAIFFTPDSGSLAGKLFLVVDGNGTAGYQSGEDFVIELANTAVPATIPDFIV